MRRSLWSLFLLLLLLATSLFADDRADVLAVFDRVNAAGMNRDAKALDTMYTGDYFHTNPDGSVMDRATVLASYKQPTQFTFSDSQRDEERVQAHDDCAVMSLRLTLQGKRGEDPFTSRYRVTYVLRKEHGRWKVANSHSSLLGITPGTTAEKK
ncbi:MAG: nuclear transport factor 2 family protein [Candidatus Koribacter versatilis]|uniref:Nuclear transport factor 2 family protein n=1 Tax=Candidatus Korobacter versatilis TaxID=658062 RepID=A0A932EPC9_9BACT|nr:nuclear transport factor 2 family protein [Candidatus Koribacter versatilis]